ncbi:hypothetical protein HMY34_13885 [Thiothrix subterranea]|uniref:hypothetical protein n=1 Tax=Thiothrix subterranea TaxID=2735563 RepID=UPI00192CAAA2|nr:hypothetical protein [Thiothrix subterranea]QQZ29776.1 hypothetical protein HMY34_13885 [Thiothrix subterranea]
MRGFVKAWWHKNKNISKSEVEWNDGSKTFRVFLEIVPKADFSISARIVNVHFHTKLLDSLKKKARRYGSLDKPYIIATTFRPSSFSAGLQLMQNILVQCLYGGGRIFNPVKKQFEPPKNLWNIDGNNKTYSNVSAVLFFDELTPYRALDPFQYCLFINDNANHRVHDGLLNIFNLYFIRGEDICSRHGLAIDSLFRNSIKDHI